MEERRSSYSHKIYRGDYFVIRGLRRFLEEKLRRLALPGYDICDVGCGEQPMRSLIESLGARYTGVDIQQNSRNTVDILADISSISLPEGSFDVILCTEVLEHVPDTEGALRELARLTKPGGKMIFTTPFFYPLHEEPHDYLRITSHQIDRLTSRLELKIDELSVSGNELEVIATVWDNLWARGFLSSRNSFKKITRIFLRLCLNLPVALGSKLFGKRLPRKSYLNTLFVLVKKGGS